MVVSSACRASRAAVAPQWRPAGDRAATVKRQNDGTVPGVGDDSIYLRVVSDTTWHRTNNNPTVTMKGRSWSVPNGQPPPSSPTLRVGHLSRAMYRRAKWTPAEYPI